MAHPWDCLEKGGVWGGEWTAGALARERVCIWVCMHMGDWVHNLVYIDVVDSSLAARLSSLMSSLVRTHVHIHTHAHAHMRTNTHWPVRLLSTLSPPLPSAGFMSSPGLPSISVTHWPHYWALHSSAPTSLQMGMSCRTSTVSAGWTMTSNSMSQFMLFFSFSYTWTYI